jgi:hypothetical protein
MQLKKEKRTIERIEEWQVFSWLTRKRRTQRRTKK